MAAQGQQADKRLQKELQKMLKEPLPNATVELVEESLFNWMCVLQGPKNSPYEKGVFKFKFTFTPQYPFHPPAVKSQQKVYHPNFDGDGNICMDLLRKEGWSPMSTVKDVLLALNQLMLEPAPDHPLDAKIAEEYTTKKPQFVKTAKEWTTKYAAAKK